MRIASLALLFPLRSSVLFNCPSSFLSLFESFTESTAADIKISQKGGDETQSRHRGSVRPPSDHLRLRSRDKQGAIDRAQTILFLEDLGSREILSRPIEGSMPLHLPTCIQIILRHD